MAEILRLPINWSGFTGAPGYTNLFFRDFTGEGVTQATVDNAVTRVDAWLQAIKIALPNTVTLVVPASLEVIEETTGILTRFVTATPAAPTTGSLLGAYSAASGACINWYTAGIRRGRRIRGRTFLVPLAGDAYDSNGTIATGILTNLNTATTALINTTGEGDLGVWARPTPLAADGIWHVVNSFTIPDKAAVLRSRRD